MVILFFGAKVRRFFEMCKLDLRMAGGDDFAEVGAEKMGVGRGKCRYGGLF